jgi:energy-coupling factor transporter ATP-binding protein EcfA2
MKKNDMDMWKESKFVDVLGRPEISAMNMGAPPLFKALFSKTAGHVTEYYQEGRVKEVPDNAEDPTKVDSLTKRYALYFEGEQEGRLIYRNLSNGGDHSIYLWKDGIADIDISGNYVSVQALSHNEKFVEGVQDFFKDQWAPAEKTGHIYAIVRHGMQLGLNSIGNAGIPLVEENYTPKVMDDYKYAINDLNNDSPSGRIIIMRGPAGTGKTHLIRAMLLQVPDAMFVLISPEVVTNLAGPELLPLLMNYRGGTTGPIVLVLEDADRCLVARGDQNMSLIQSLLNLGDGILGSLLDIRIVATTNADELNLDKAVTRPGRLSKMLDVDHLDPLTAQKIFRRLLPDTNFPVEINGSTNPKDFKVTLAEVYSLARKNGWSASPRKVDDTDDGDEMDDWDE